MPQQEPPSLTCYLGARSGKPVQGLRTHTTQQVLADNLSLQYRQSDSSNSVPFGATPKFSKLLGENPPE